MCIHNMKGNMFKVLRKHNQFNVNFDLYAKYILNCISATTSTTHKNR